MGEAREFLRFCTEVYELQVSESRYFLHEHPLTAKSWEEPSVKRVMGLEGR